jgi:hypothetical protein
MLYTHTRAPVKPHYHPLYAKKKVKNMLEPKGSMKKSFPYYILYNFKYTFFKMEMMCSCLESHFWLAFLYMFFFLSLVLVVVIVVYPKKLGKPGCYFAARLETSSREYKFVYFYERSYTRLMGWVKLCQT